MLTVYLVTTVLWPYALHRLLARLPGLRDEARRSPTAHAETVTAACVLATAVYAVGGYATAYGPLVTPLAASGTVAALSAFSALPASMLPTSLDGFRRAGWSGRIAVGLCFAIVLAGVAAHVREAVAVWGLRLALVGYLGPLLLLPLAGGVLVFAVAERERQTRRSRDLGDDEAEEEGADAYAFALGEDEDDEIDDDDDVEQAMTTRRDKTTAATPESGSDDERARLTTSASVAPAVAKEDEVDGQEADDADDDASVRVIPPTPLRRTPPPRTTRTTRTTADEGRARHHGRRRRRTPRLLTIRRSLHVRLPPYQAAAFLAAFARSPTVASRLAAGVALGAMVHGLAARGAESCFHYREDR